MLLYTYLLFSPWDKARIESIAARRNKPKIVAELLQEAVSPLPPLPAEANSAKAVLFHPYTEMKLKDLRFQQSFCIFFPQEKKRNPHFYCQK